MTEEKKPKYYSDAQKRATAKYKADKYKRVPFDVKMSFYEETIQPAVKQSGMSLNGFLKEAVSEKVARMSVPVRFTVPLSEDDLNTFENEAKARDMTLEEMVLEALKVFIKEY